MFNLEVKKNGDVMILALSGRIDSTNAADVQQQINAVSAGFDGKLVIDAEDLEYISSAGLRIVLRLKKANSSAEIINVSSDVYEIFDVTGFTEMMSISKAYRKISIDGCEVIGEGANGKVYRIDPDTIVKVYKSADALHEIHNERELARKAFVMGVPTAIPYDVVKVGELYGSVFELLNAESFNALLKDNPDCLDELAKDSVEILKTIHSTMLKENELPNKKAEALSWAEFCKPYLPEETGEKLCRLIAEIPDALNMLHGDYHIKNIMRQNGENLLIDMDTLAMGHPIFEFSAIYLAYQGFSCIDQQAITRFFGISYAQGTELWRKTLKYYFNTDDEKFISDIEDKAATICYARVLRRTIRKADESEDYKARMIEFCKQTLIERVSRLSSLAY